MRRNLRFLLMFCAGLFVLCGNGVGQVRDQAAEDAVRIARAAERRLDNLSFRMTLHTEWFTERKGDIFTEALETLQVVTPDRYQSISDVRGTRIDTIVVADKTFRRTNDGDWESVAVPPIRKAGNASASGVGGFNLEFGLNAGTGKFIAKGTIDGREVSMYEILTLRQDGTPERGVRTETAQYWINSEGLIVRRVIEHEFVGDKRIMRATANYTYTDIRVDEPILPVTTQK